MRAHQRREHARPHPRTRSLHAAGLDDASLALTKKFDEIVYISCNPAKLRAELDSFDEHQIVSAALFDQVNHPT